MIGGGHYVTYTPQAGWVDTPVVDGLGNYYYTHAASVTTDSAIRFICSDIPIGETQRRATLLPAVINCYRKRIRMGPGRHHDK
jgi:hypothetical protein